MHLPKQNPRELAGCTGAKENTIKPKFNTLTEREERLARLLIDKPQGVTRKECEPLIGTTYAPNIVKTLRDDYGLRIPCTLVKSRDRDGKPCTYGVYAFTSESRSKALQLLGGTNG
jgi:hypothetical protein